MTHDAASLRLLFPAIPWDEPVKITVPGWATGYACRYCIAKGGLRGQDVAGLPQDPELVRKHIKDWHP